MTTDLNSALIDLKSRIASGFTAGIVAEVADDWDVRPELLDRKFREATGKAPEDFAVLDVSAALRSRARALAAEWRKEFRGGDGSLTGRTFFLSGREMVAAAWSSEGIHCIRVDSGERRIVTFPNIAAAAAYIERVGLL